MIMQPATFIQMCESLTRVYRGGPPGHYWTTDPALAASMGKVTEQQRKVRPVDLADVPSPQFDETGALTSLARAFIQSSGANAMRWPASRMSWYQKGEQPLKLCRGAADEWIIYFIDAEEK